MELRTIKVNKRYRIRGGRWVPEIDLVSGEEEVRIRNSIGEARKGTD